MPYETRKCSVQDLQPKYAAEIRRYLSTEERILVCYETKYELSILERLSGGGYEEHYYAQVITQNQAINTGRYGKREYVASMRLVDIANVAEDGRSPYFRVIAHGHGDNRIEFNFASEHTAQAFSNILRQGIAQAKSASVASSSQSPSSIQERLQILTKLRNDGLISEGEFQQKRQEILREI